MHQDTPDPCSSSSRRGFLLGSAGAVVSLGVAGSLSATPARDPKRKIKIALVGCGGRGAGAASQALHTEGEVELVAMGDAFSDRLESTHQALKAGAVGERVQVPESQRFVGFDAYKKVLAVPDVELVILATPPHFRPDHFKEAVAYGKHVFMEKPVAVDGAGIRTVLETARLADDKNISVQVGLQRHHQAGYIQTMERVHRGDIGRIVAARCYWNMGFLWNKERQPEWSDMEWQMRNWLYFTWLSGDHIVEQHIHNIDVINWAMQANPVRAHGMGGRQVRTDAAFGHIFDHHAVEFEYPDGTRLFSQCRQIRGCKNDVSEHLMGTKGNCDITGGRWAITGDNPWNSRLRDDPFQVEHDDLFAALREGRHVNEAKYGAESTLSAIMGRMATYSGRDVTREQVLESERLGPTEYEWGSIETPRVPTPGVR